MTRILLVLGCLGLSAAAAAEPPSFSRDVAPILYNSCVSCHRPGEVAPMSLVSYEDARPWAKSIRAKVASREMPPWGADPHYGTFKDDRSLSAAQIDTIVKWADGGAPRGNDADLPRMPSFTPGWSHGEPDVVIDMPVEFAIPAEGEVPVIDFFTKSPFTQDVYVKALEVREGTPGVIHHAGLYVIDRLPEGAKLVNGRIIGADGEEMSRNQVARANGGTSTQEIQKLLSFVPGRGYEEYQGDAGQLIKAGSYIDFYMHYTPNGTADEGSLAARAVLREAGTDGRPPDLSLVRRRRPDLVHRRGQGVHAAAARRGARGQREPAEHSAVRGELQGRQRAHDHRAGHAVRADAAPAPARQEHEVHADVARRDRGGPARRARSTTSTGSCTTSCRRRRRFRPAARSPS